jgi:glucokinase
MPDELNMPDEDCTPEVTFLGIDVGGTNIKCAAWTDGEFTDLGHSATPASGGPEAVRGAIIELVKKHADRLHTAGRPVRAVGVTMPGTVDGGAGTVGVIPNIPGDWAGFAVAGPVSAACGLPVFLINDARAFALAEATAGAARGLHTVVCMTLGTGVGGGVVIGGRLHGGATGLAGEVGHQCVDLAPDAPACGCGGRGHLETLTRADAMLAGGYGSVEEVFAAARAGDLRAARAVDREVGYLAVGLANAYMLLCPDAFVIGGGIAQAGDQLRVPLLAEVRRRVSPLHAGESIDIRAAALGPAAGAIGAALWARERARSRISR